MGDVISGLFQGGSSGSIGAGRGNIKQKNNYIGENNYQKPLEDIMGLLAAEANQQRAQRNLMFGGAGYGGSFESADQRAARAAGGSLNEKPYGGWGGYGSENPAMGGTAPQAPPAVYQDDEVTGGQPTPIGGGGSTDIPLGDNGEDILDPVTPGGSGNPAQVIPGYTPPGGGTQAMMTAGAAPPTGMEAYGAKPNRHAALTAQANNPDVKKVQALLAAKGVTNMPDPQDIAFSLGQAGGPDALANHYMGLIQSSGDPSGHAVFVQSHGTLGRVLAKDVGQNPAGWGDILGGEDGVPTPANAGGSTSGGGGQSTFLGGGANMVATVPGDEGPYNMNDDPGGEPDPWDPDDPTVGSGGTGNGGGGGGGGDTAATTYQNQSPFGEQGFNPDDEYVIDPKTGKPVLNMSGYSQGDAWSTSPQWRPDEPTGGLYGAYSQLASGNLTPYENAIMTGYQDYARTPGRGEDEAYGAYGDMLKGGYSDSEKNAITQEGMRAARAGFETNRDSMLRNQARTNNSAGYAANMAKMARGFSETMGSQGRQNEIKFADETQRRKEGGASGMLNVANLANTRTQTGLQGQQSAAAYGRGLQQQGLQGLHALYTGSDPTKQWATAAGIASNPRETYTESGNASL